jgi:hypothetical protein
MNLRTLALAALAALAVPACTGQEAAPEDTAAAASAAAVTKLYASQGSLDLIVETLGKFEQRDGVRAVVLHGTANRYLQDVFSFVPDDAFGEANIISERRFEIVLHEGHELNTVLSGLPLFVSIDTFTGSPTHYVARIDFGARFYDFLGSSAIWIDEEVNPYYVVNGTDNISYRGAADVLATQLTVTAPDGAPAVTQTDPDSFRLGWSYTALHQAVDPHTSYLSFNAALPGGTTASKNARLVVRAVDLALTAGDPYEVWPHPGCQPEAYSCIHAQPPGATDFSACGLYREVTSCLYADECEVFPAEDLSLTPIDDSSLDPAVTAWNQNSNGGAWHGFDLLDAFATPACPADPITIQAVMDEIAATDQNQPPVEYGDFTNRAGLSQNVFFAQSYYGDGAALLAALDAFAGGGEIQAWLYTSEFPCHNCHNWDIRAVLYYPASGKVILLDGHYGYDS